MTETHVAPGERRENAFATPPFSAEAAYRCEVATNRPRRGRGARDAQAVPAKEEPARNRVGIRRQRHTRGIGYAFAGMKRLSCGKSG